MDETNVSVKDAPPVEQDEEDIPLGFDAATAGGGAGSISMLLILKVVGVSETETPLSAWQCLLDMQEVPPRMAPTLCKAKSSLSITTMPIATHSITRGPRTTHSCKDQCKRRQWS
jgi:hypothetical protein